MSAPDPDTHPRRISRERLRGPTTVARLAERLTRTALGKRGFAAADIIARWPEITGPDLASLACPLQVKFPRGRNAGATLLLRVSSSAAATLLQFKSPVIVARVNRFFGYEAVARIETSHGPLPPRPRPPPPEPAAPECSGALAAATAGVASEPIRDALRKLGARLQLRDRNGVVSSADTSD
jgi:hypothetical protein